MIGKGENNWDRFSHAGGNVKNNDTGDVACDSYNKYKDDIKLMKDMGVSFLFGCLLVIKLTYLFDICAIFYAVSYKF